jgi:hypothetical protein
MGWCRRGWWRRKGVASKGFDESKRQIDIYIRKF